MDEKQIKACVDYINKNAARLHGVEPEKLNIGPDVKPEAVVSSHLQGAEAVLVIDRGIKGTPKYILNLDEVQKGTPPKASSEAVEAEAKKVDAVQARLKGR